MTLAGRNIQQRLALTLAVAVVVAFVAPSSASAVRGPSVVPCSAEAVVLTTSARLDPSCQYTGGLEITASNVTLDCRGAVIDGTGAGGTGILVHASVEADLSQVTIRDCVVRGFLNSIRITRDGFRALPAGHEYDHGVRGVVIERTRVSGSRGVGLYVDGYVTDTTIRDSTVTGAGSSGIYLEAGSARNVVVRNAIRDNGFRENGPGGSLFSFSGVQFRFWGIGREGISIDGSRRNLVSGNTFEGNSAGGIFLYTNCGEYVRSKPERWFQRRYGADDNLILANSFEGGVNGVWVGSRMGENILPMGCSDPTYAPGISLDRAARNTIAVNSFRDVTYRGAGRGRRHQDPGEPLQWPGRGAPRGGGRHAAAHCRPRAAGPRHGTGREHVDDPRQPEPVPLGGGPDPFARRVQPRARPACRALSGQDASARPVRHDAGHSGGASGIARHPGARPHRAHPRRAATLLTGRAPSPPGGVVKCGIRRT